MKPIQPKAFKVSAFLGVIEKEANQIGKEVKGMYERFVETWDNKPKFTIVVKVSRERVTISVITNDKIFGYLNKGTKRHFVGPKNKKALYFQKGYKPKTRAGLVGSMSGGASGEFVSSSGHYVSGIKPRNFDKTAKKVYQPVMRKRFQGALNRAAHASGHSMRR